MCLRCWWLWRGCANPYQTVIWCPGMVSGGSDVMSGGSEVVSGGRSVVSRFSGSLNGSVDLAKI